MFQKRVVGKVIFIKGQAFLELESWRVQLELRSPVYEGSALVTEKGGTLQVRFQDDSLLSLSANSRLAIDQYVYDPDNAENCNLLFDLGMGSFQFNSGLIGKQKPENLNIKTPSAMMTIRGSGFSVKISPEGEQIGLL